ncbi:hypothetical protein [Gynuella sunshinyii]|uniref:Uncharacterized protein n=1 Tax=Gynuella sunshinyii YC6258 TaxID=1445510 RepID=A0A0C5VCP0_9GAMM|nr:hypothetical protein [Gynuella sunshinyii]AJQ97105.1 hypothetical Protein YC6258_05075 [Gynuella sunshinyii YC6258]
MVGVFFRLFAGTILDFSKRDNVFFWISQMAVVVSTIIGVYLATSEGLKSAVEFHSITSMEKKYYTLNALHQELTSNNDLMRQYVERFLNKDDKGQAVSHNGVGVLPELNLFVWDTMSNSSDTLDLPVDILRDANRYYLQLADITDSLKHSSGYETLRNGSALEQLTVEAREKLLSRIEQQLAEYQQRLKVFTNLGKY